MLTGSIGGKNISTTAISTRTTNSVSTSASGLMGNQFAACIQGLYQSCCEAIEHDGPHMEIAGRKKNSNLSTETEKSLPLNSAIARFHYHSNIYIIYPHTSSTAFQAGRRLEYDLFL